MLSNILAVKKATAIGALILGGTCFTKFVIQLETF